LPQGAITDTSIGIKTRNAIAWNGRWWLSHITYDKSQSNQCNKKWWPTRCSIVPSVGGTPNPSFSYYCTATASQCIWV